jgi:hypothetical protein
MPFMMHGRDALHKEHTPSPIRLAASSAAFGRPLMSAASIAAGGKPDCQIVPWLAGGEGWRRVMNALLSDRRLLSLPGGLATLDDGQAGMISQLNPPN